MEKTVEFIVDFRHDVMVALGMVVFVLGNIFAKMERPDAPFLLRMFTVVVWIGGVVGGMKLVEMLSG